ncbi:MAG TPA: xanthine dehydrogenase family protein subunit M [Candidatus Solibacter sp.]|jgi:carbon-monoxide dehydrogenase medium subunit
MIANQFTYYSPATLEEAFTMLEDGSGKILAGGMSLIPLMKLRLASPESVIDLRRIPGLKQITESDGVVRIGAMTTHHEIETSPVIRGKCPLLGEAASEIGDIQVRNMGTIGGSVAHADPAADYPAALVALEAHIRLRSAQGERTVEASEFFLDAFTTAIEPGEIVVAIEIAAEEPSEGYKYEKVPHPASGFPVVGVAVRVKKSGAGIAMARIGVTGMGPHAFRARNAEALLQEGAGAAAAAAVVGEGEETNSDLYASGEYRRHLARIHAARAIAAALTRIS